MATALAAKVGSRLSHSAIPVDLAGGALVAAALGGNVVGPAGLGGAGAAALGAGVGSARGPEGASAVSVRDLIPVITHGVVAVGVPDVMLGPGQMAVNAPSAPQPCAPHVAQPILAGSASVLVHGKQLVRVGDLTSCGAQVCDGVKTVSIGGPQGAGARPREPMGDLASSLGAVVLGAVLTQTGALEMAAQFGAALTGAVDKAEKVVDTALDTAEKVVEGVGTAASEAVARVGEVLGSVTGGALGALFGGGAPPAK